VSPHLLTSTPAAAAAPATPAASPAPPPTALDAEALLRRVGASPYVRVERRGERATIAMAAHGERIAALDLATGALTVFVAAALAGPLLAREALLRVTRTTVHLDVLDAHSRRVGERLLRWRLELELFGAQWRNASP
jgi:hypothetical protein